MTNPLGDSRGPCVAVGVAIGENDAARPVSEPSGARTAHAHAGNVQVRARPLDSVTGASLLAEDAAHRPARPRLTTAGGSPVGVDAAPQLLADAGVVGVLGNQVAHGATVRRSAVSCG